MAESTDKNQDIPKPISVTEPEVVQGQPHAPLRAAYEQATKDKDPAKIRKAAEEADKKPLPAEKANEIDKKVADAKAKEEADRAAAQSVNGKEKPATNPEAKEEKPTDKRKSIADLAKGEEPVKAEAKEGEKEGDLSFEEVEARDGDSERYRKRANAWKGIKGQLEKERDEYKKKAEEAIAKAQELEQKVGVVPDDIKSQLDELAQYRYRFNLEAAPEVKQYDTKIADAESVVMDTLKTASVPGWIEEAISKAGGIIPFSKSRKEWTIKKQDGSGNENVTEAELYNRLVNSLNAGERDVIRGTLAEVAKLAKEKERFVKEKSTKAKEHFAELEKQQQESVKAQEKAVNQVKEAIAKTIDTFSTTAPWMKDVDESFGENYKAENTRRSELRAHMAEFKNVPALAYALANSTKEDAELLQNTIVAAVRAFDLKDSLASANEKIKSLEAEVKKLKGAGISTMKAGAAKESATAVASSMNPARLPGESDFAYNYRIAKEKKASAA